ERLTKVLDETVVRHFLSDARLAVEALIEIAQLSKKAAGKSPALDTQAATKRFSATHALSQAVVLALAVASPGIHNRRDVDTASQLMTVVDVIALAVIEERGQCNCSEQCEHRSILS